tara:strand:- start:1154 stop:1975 length:822 start_codon:yes stop_codon:yes gene_type:complete
MSIADLTFKEKVALLKKLYLDIANKGQDGDTMLAHINPSEAILLKAHGGSGTINPITGLPEYKKAIKTAVIVAAAYYGGSALMSAYGAAGATASIHTGIAGIAAGGGMTLSTALSIGGMGMQAMGSIQSRKYQQKGADMNRAAMESQNRANEVANRYRQLQQKRQRLTQIRGARIRQGQVEGATAGTGLGAGGTSALSGSVGGTGTQVAANLGNINVAQGVGNQISGLNTMSANYSSQANSAASKAEMWNQVDTLGGNLMTQGGEISNIFGKR